MMPSQCFNVLAFLRFRVSSLLRFCVSVFVLLSTSAAHGEGKFATTQDDVKIYYETIGTGVPMVMIAGGPGGSSAGFRHTHTVLQASGQLVFLDNRGRGRSQDVGDRPDPYSLQNDLKDVEAVRKAIGAERIIVYGHSYGSMVALAYAARYPEHTQALITTAGTHGAHVWQGRNIDEVKRHLERHYPDRWARIVELHDAGRTTGEGELATLFRGLGELYYHHPESQLRLHARFEDHRDSKAIRFNAAVYRAMLGDDPEWTVGGTLKGVELLPELGNYKGPALIMGGRFDRICPPLNQMEIAQALVSAKLIIFEHSGHSPFNEEPLRFLKVVSDFIREVSPPQERSQSR